MSFVKIHGQVKALVLRNLGFLKKPQDPRTPNSRIGEFFRIFGMKHEELEENQEKQEESEENLF